MATENPNQGASAQERAPEQPRKKGAPERQAEQPARQSREQKARGQSTGIAPRESFLPSAFGGALPLSPFGLMRRMFEDMDRFFENFGQVQRGGGFAGALWSPPVEVLQRDGELVVRADLPGTKEEDIRVEVQGDALILEGERKSEQEEERGGIWRSERSYGSFRRVIPLPEGVDVENASANFNNGVLEIRMKLPQEQQARRIQVKGGSTQEQKGMEAGGEQKQSVH